jgi:hypothetical protein
VLAVGAGPVDGAGWVGLVEGGEASAPAAEGFESMVESAQGHQVTSAGCATPGIGDHVIKITVLGAASAAGVAAGLVQGDDLVDQGSGWFVAGVLVRAVGVVAGSVSF